MNIDIHKILHIHALLLAIGLLWLSCATALAQESQAARHSGRAMIHGRVVDEDGEPLVGASVRLVTLKPRQRLLGETVTDSEGRFRLPGAAGKPYVTVRYLGYLANTVAATPGDTVVVRLRPDVKELQETVVTGYYSKAKSSFTGTAVQVTGDELRQVNHTNLFDALKVFDPSFQVVDTYGQFGSDPNHVPDKIEIRGQNTMPDISQSNLQTMTSLPIFMLDGFEVNVRKIYDLDMNRIKSVTLLKDASASAIYGSRAANGVVVIETRTPQSGKLQVSYSLNGKFELPDLSSYNLMNAAEALAFQKAAGVFDAYREGEDPGNNLNSYNAVRRAVLNGADTYWLSKPLQVGFRQKHSLMIEGSVGKPSGQNHHVRFAVNLGYSRQDGVMKGSNRTSYEAGTKLIYQSPRLSVTNDLQFSLVTADESPYGRFSSYTSALPYYQEKDASGRYHRTLSIANLAPPGMALGVLASQRSPLYEAHYLNSYTTTEATSILDNLGFNWSILGGLRLRGTLSVNYDFGRSDAYLSPGSFTYTNDNSNGGSSPDVLYSRGKYEIGNSSGLTYYASAVLSYTRSYGPWDIQSILGGEARQSKTESDGYALTGFLGDAQDYLSYAVQYQRFGRISGTENTVRSAGIFTNQNFSYDNRYLCDLTCRLDGSSLYGRKQRQTPYWSVGLRWNIDNERFLKRHPIVNRLVLRANIGTTGNQNYTRNQASNMYSYLPRVYGGHFGAVVPTLANPDLHGQTTYNRNLGFETSLFGNRLNFELNLYYNSTKGNLTSVTIAPSVGYDSYKTNMGDLTNRGFDFSLSYSPIKTKDLLLNFTLNGTRNRNRIERISDALLRYNDTVNKAAQNAEGNASTVFLFKEGESMNTIYAVRSLGIDPGTGHEIYLDRNGNPTYTWRAADQVAVGVNEPTLQGYFGLNFRYKEWELGTNVNYAFGADKYNYTLHQKIENVDYMVNNDRRALTERWQQPGDIARYKAITDNSATKATSRFVQRENRLGMTSLRLSYTVPGQRLRRTWLSLLKFSLTANELFYLSTIRQERGLAYPFTRSATFSAQLHF